MGLILVRKTACAWAVKWDLHFSLIWTWWVPFIQDNHASSFLYKIKKINFYFSLQLTYSRCVCVTFFSSIQKACKFRTHSVLHLLAKKTLFTSHYTLNLNLYIYLSLSLSDHLLFLHFQLATSISMSLELIIVSSDGSQNRHILQSSAISRASELPSHLTNVATFLLKKKSHLFLYRIIYRLCLDIKKLLPRLKLKSVYCLLYVYDKLNLCNLNMGIVYTEKCTHLSFFID